MKNEILHDDTTVDYIETHQEAIQKKRYIREILITITELTPWYTNEVGEFTTDKREAY